MPKPTEILLPEQAAEVAEYITSELQPDKSFIERIAGSKCFANTVSRSAEKLRALETWERKVEAGEKTKKNKDGSVSTLTMDDVDHITRLDRWYNAEPEIIEGIAMRTHHPLDGHLLSDDFGVDNGDE